MEICLKVWQKPLLIFIFMVFTLQTSNLSLPIRITTKTASNEIHDIIAKNGLPRGLIPNIIKSYTLSEDGHFQIILQHSCYVQFEQVVYYNKIIKGILKYGSATSVSGIQAKKFFVWLPVTGIHADIQADMVEFFVGFLSVKLPAKQFQEIPECMNSVCSEESTHSESMR